MLCQITRIDVLIAVDNRVEYVIALAHLLLKDLNLIKAPEKQPYIQAAVRLQKHVEQQHEQNRTTVHYSLFEPRETPHHPRTPLLHLNNPSLLLQKLIL